MFGSSRAPVTFVDVLWSLFHLLKGMPVRMEHATASSASSNAVEIRLQELRSSAGTRGREWLQDALAEISATLSVKVTVVVTMCANEMEIRGAPKDWAQHFQQEKVFHVKCHLEDTTLKPPHRWEERIPDLVVSCLEQWKIVCGQLWKQSMLAVTRGESMHVLFHCFGGINRSAGVLCAWLVVGYNYSAEDAVQLLLQKRPSLRPWHNRPYVLEALWQLEGLRAEWHMELSAAGTN